MKQKTNFRWIIKIIILSIAISIVFTLVSQKALDGAGYIIAFVILFLFIAVGILFDIIGVAVTSASVVPFNSMASHRERGAAEALKLIKNAEKVSSVCNDVVGDIAGIVSGTTSAVIVAKLVDSFSLDNIVIQLLVSGLVAGATIGGKAIGKGIAINNNTGIVLTAGKCINFINRIFKGK